MNIDTPSDGSRGNNTQPISRISKYTIPALITLAFLCCVFVFLTASWGYASEARTGDWSLLALALYEATMLPAVIIACVIVAIIGTIKAQKVFRYISLTVIMFGILFFTKPIFHSAAKAFSPVLYPLIDAQEKASIGNQIAKSDRAKEDHYKYFSEAFATEKTVTDVPCFGSLILDHTFYIALPDLDGHGVPTSVIKERLASKILGKQVKVFLPPHDAFIAGYQPGVASGCYGAAVKQWPRHGDEALGEIHASVEVNGQIVNLGWIQR